MKIITLFIFLFFVSASVMSQVQFSGGVSGIRGVGEDDNHNYMFGAGLGVKYAFNDNYLIGITARKYRRNTHRYDEFSATDKNQNLTATFEYIIVNAKIFKPYVGVDAGLSQTTHIVNGYTYKNDFFVAALKAGTYLSLGKLTGLFGQVQYNYVSGGGKSTPTPGVSDAVLTEPIGKFLAADIGFYIRLKKKNTKNAR